MVDKLLAASAIKEVELKAWIGRENLRYSLQPFAQSRGRKQRVLALAQVVIIDIQVKRKQVNGDGVRKGRGGVIRPRLFVHAPGIVAGGLFAKLKGIHAGFSTHAA